MLLGIKMEYSGRGYFSGKAHTFKATVTRPGLLPSTQILHTIEGQWDSTSRDKRTGAEFSNVLGPKEEVIVAPIEEQEDAFESRKLWEKVAKGIRSGDYEMASREKSKIENEQRQRRRDEAAKGEKWQLKHFVRVEQAPDCES